MKLFTFIVLALMLVGTTAMAAEVPTSRGDKAMVFMFNGLDDLHVDGYGQYGVGMRYYIADGTAIRAGVQFGKYTWTDDDPATDADFDSEENAGTYGVNAVYERHMAGPCSSVSPYWGVGGAYLSLSNEEMDEDGDTDTDRWAGFAGYAVLGFEWGFTNCMTLGGEYQAGFWSASMETEEVTGGVSTLSDAESETFMGFSTMSVYLSVYW